MHGDILAEIFVTVSVLTLGSLLLLGYHIAPQSCSITCYKSQPQNEQWTKYSRDKRR